MNEMRLMQDPAPKFECEYEFIKQAANMCDFVKQYCTEIETINLF